MIIHVPLIMDVKIQLVNIFFRIVSYGKDL